MTILKQKSLQVVNSRLREVMANVRCSAHPDKGRVTAQLSELDRVKFSISACCETFQAEVEQRLREAGAMDMTVDTAGATERDGKSSPPTAFLSHSHADKESLVRPLDALLRERGIRPWLDERDMPAGANLMDSIFKAGISGSDVFIAVLTPTSINSAWVHEELSVAVIRRLQKRVRLIIPIVYAIEEDQVPDALVATKWIRLADVSTAELVHCANEIAISLFGAIPPPVAPPPAYAGIPVHRLTGITANDERLFAQIYRWHLDLKFFHPAINTAAILEYAQTLGLTEEAVLESLEVLKQHGYLAELGYYLGSGPMPQDVRVSEYGVEAFLTVYDPDRYAAAKASVLSEIINKNSHSQLAIMQATGLSHPMVHHILKRLELSGHARVLFHGGGDASVIPQPSIRRLLD